jgi:Na+-transporting NADH:ubiquinone oxidoreductase subunit C
VRSSTFIIIFISLLTAVVAFVLSLMYTGLKDLHDENEAIFNKKSILFAIQEELGEDVAVMQMTNDEIQAIFDSSIVQKVVDINGKEFSKEEIEAAGYLGGMAENVNLSKEKKKPIEERLLPLYIYEGNPDNPLYIMTLKGNGLWDEVSGNIALDDDFRTIVGSSFDHVGETPGMGAEIKDNPNFRLSFIGKTIYDENGNYTSVQLRKGGAINKTFEIDGITAATLTGDGINIMLDKGIKSYEAYFNKLKN